MRIENISGINSTYFNSRCFSNPNFKSNTCEFKPSKDLEQYKKAQAYADSLIKKYGRFQFDKCDFRKLEGIQYNIPIFKDLDINQTMLTYHLLRFILLYRGCTNNCVHCFAEATSPANIEDNKEIAQTMSWEDFTTITKSIEELDSRLQVPKEELKTPIITFFDADSMETIIKDASGKKYDLVDISNEITSRCGRKILFDTSGWDHRSNTMQKRAEKYVQHMIESYKANDGIFSSHYQVINISFNPFHSIHAKSIENLESNPKLAEKLRNLYIDRMANVFYTFTPLFEKQQFNIINRAINDESDCDENYKVNNHKKLISDVREKLQDLYVKAGLEKEEIDKNLALFDIKTNHVASERVFVLGRLKKLFKPDSPEIKIVEKIHKKKEKNPRSILYRGGVGLVVDTNGKTYLTDSFDNIPTDITLNISSKDKLSPVLFGILKKNVTAKEIVAEFQSFKYKCFSIFQSLKFRFLHKFKNPKIKKLIQKIV